MSFTARIFGLPAAVKVGFLDLSRCAAVEINLKGGRYRSCSSKILSVTLTSTAFACFPIVKVAVGSDLKKSPLAQNMCYYTNLRCTFLPS